MEGSRRYISMMAILCCLLVIMLCVLFFYAIPRLQTQPVQLAISEQPKVTSVVAQSAALSAPQLDFYTELSKVPVRAVANKKSPKEIDAPTSIKRGKYVLQLAAFKQSDDAHVFSDRLSLLGYQAFVMKWDQHHRTLYRVCVGPYSSKQAAFPDQLKLKKLHIESYVRKLTASA